MTAALRVMSFNINGANEAQDDPNARTRRAPLNIGLMHSHAPDLIGMQEVHPVNLETYRTQLTGYAHIKGNCSGRLGHGQRREG